MQQARQFKARGNELRAVTDHSADDTPTEREDLYAKFQLLSRLMDTQFQVPGIGWRFGLDGLLGLIPGLGDTLGMAASGYIISLAARLGVSPSALLRMTGNVLIDALLGLIPLLGDLLDFSFKANRRNADILKESLKEKDLRPRSSAEAAKVLRGAILGLLLLALAITALPIVGLLLLL